MVQRAQGLPANLKRKRSAPALSRAVMETLEGRMLLSGTFPNLPTGYPEIDFGPGGSVVYTANDGILKVSSTDNFQLSR